ncbi:hypothetical protein CBOM_01900 [Ceraceosorus bombacis]|uniref:Uncharacterized protein n=1 Tax=Ceraceosorus bombacis TaxID=401625 RepID=A0A0P1BEI0_9BASI|nr:hypothetical protein CBOM_01900 [Ceraceosorus bombacis]
MVIQPPQAVHWLSVSPSLTQRRRAVELLAAVHRLHVAEREGSVQNVRGTGIWCVEDQGATQSANLTSS